MNDKNKSAIVYPCTWEYKIIGADEKKIYETISKVMDDCKHIVSPSNVSNKGKYYSICLSTEVLSEEMRNDIFQKLTNAPAVKIVL